MTKPMPAAAQRERREERGGGERQDERDRDGREMAVPAVQEAGRRVGRDAEEPGVAQADEAGVAHQHVDPEREDGVEEDLAADVDVEGAAGPERQCGQGQQRGDEGEALHPAAGRPKRPWGRTTRTRSMGRNSTT